jgi:hypothetical protein
MVDCEGDVEAAEQIYKQAIDGEFPGPSGSSIRKFSS